MPARILRTNRIQASGTVLGSSSIESSLPVAWLRDQLVSKAPRTKLGWDFVTGAFLKLDFTEDVNARVATIAVANNQTGAEAATALTTAMNAATNPPASPNTYTVTYSASTKKFTIARTAGANTFSLDFAAGAPSFATSVHHDFGFNDSNKTGATSYEGDNAVYQSRKWFHADLGSSLAHTWGAVRYHNAGTGGTFKLRGSTTSVLDALTAAAPTLNQTLAGGADLRIAMFGSTSVRYLVLLIDDTTNQDGYSEVGIWGAGTYDEPPFNPSIDRSDVYEDLSEVHVAIGGAHYQEEREDRQTFTLTWEELEDADRDTLLAVKDATKKGKNFFLVLDPAAPTTTTIYGFRPADMTVDLVGPGPSGSYWNVSMPFAEALP